MDRQLFWISEKKWGKFKEVIIELNVRVLNKKRFKGEIKDAAIIELLDNWTNRKLSQNEIKAMQLQIGKLKNRGKLSTIDEYKRVNLKIPFDNLKLFRARILGLFGREVEDRSLTICFNNALENWLDELEDTRISRFLKKFRKEIK